MDADADREHLASDRLRRSVMQRLRQEGYNAAICKSRWKHGDGLPGGDYEYIDIVMESKTGAKKHDRFIVDIDFRAQFEIARASKQYGQLLDVLPKLFVGRPERLKQVLKIMTNAAKCSLKEQGLLLPPWRKQKYVYAKWFSSYRRTINPESAFSSHNLLDLGSKAPKILSLDFTKEMDLLFYMAQMRGARNGHRHSQCPGNDPRRGNLGTNNAPFIKTGFLTSSSDRLPSDFNECTTATCTDWQLPPLDETRNVSNSRGKVSGISTAFKHPASISKPPTVPRLTMVS
ncbi:hypothetical protein KP509_30G052600 [Ceratopteris richardii]|nr:hypothetical protein KP509_30G052600 [Ceratopteris richardii]